MKKALIVGIDNYPQARLSSCVNDATLMAGLLQEHGSGLNNFEIKLETDIFTKSVLKTKLVELFAGECETALFYFSGHGCVSEFGGCIVTPDAKKYDEGVLMDEILKLANNSKAMNKIIILDCCYSGNMGTPAVLGMGASYINDGVTILTASRHNETALAKGACSVFTSLLAEALQGGAADVIGRITPGSIYAFIEKALGFFEQRPVFKTNTSRFVSLRKVEPKVSLEVLKRITAYFTAPDQVHLLAPSYEDTNTPGRQPVREPYAVAEHVAIFKDLQQFQGAGLVVPVDADFMFFAAMESRSCKLTALGSHYWRLVKDKRIG